MELTTGKQLHLGNYLKNINNNKQLLRIWIELRAAKKKKTKHNETLWLKLSLHLFITVLMIIMQLYFFFVCNGIFHILPYRKSIQYTPYNSILKRNPFKNKVLIGFGIIKFSRCSINHS